MVAREVDTLVDLRVGREGGAKTVNAGSCLRQGCEKKRTGLRLWSAGEGLSFGFAARLPQNIAENEQRLKKLL